MPPLVGDISANVEKLNSQLRMLRFPMRDFMQQGVFAGNPVALLPILHFIFLSFSPVFAEYLYDSIYAMNTYIYAVVRRSSVDTKTLLQFSTPQVYS